MSDLQVDSSGQEKRSLQDKCERERQKIKNITENVVDLLNDEELVQSDNSLPSGNLPRTRNENVHENVTLAFHSLEDARMRLGKVMQALQGGVSVFDKDTHKNTTECQ